MTEKLLRFGKSFQLPGQAFHMSYLEYTIIAGVFGKIGN